MQDPGTAPKRPRRNDCSQDYVVVIISSLVITTTNSPPRVSGCGLRLLNAPVLITYIKTT